ncbi:hypothetical protein Tco_1089129, partial [Tanacetum coccineum]
IRESLVKKKQKGAILELKRRHLKNTIFYTHTLYPAIKIRRISASSSQETRNDQFPIWRPIPPKTAKQKLARKNELKAKSTLLLAIPDEYLLKFHSCKDAQSLWEAIKNRFGGNKESTKMQKTILKQQYENFDASRSEGLDKTYDRFQKLISQLEIYGEVISQEDANLKLLRSLPSSWNNIALIMRNKSDLDELSMDDLYNNLKVYEAKIKGQLICMDIVKITRKEPKPDKNGHESG